MPNQQQNSVLKSIESLNKQCEQAWQETEKIFLPPAYKQPKNAVAAGMGGSALAAHWLKTVFAKKLKIPLEIVNDYHLPGYANQNTLVFLLSYSGQTEEILNATQEALNKKCLPIVIASNGKLAEMARKNLWPAYLFNPVNNPSGQPRLGLGYLLASLLVFFKNLNFLDLNKESLPQIWQELEKNNLALIKKQAQKMAKALQNKNIILLGAEHFAGNLHILANQINESAKQFATYFLLPEINHHLLEGLAFPKTNSKNFHFVFFSSCLFHSRLQKRFALTQEILKKQNFSYSLWQPKTKTWLAQSLELLRLGGFLSFYLAQLNHCDPMLIPWVDYFKKKMG